MVKYTFPENLFQTANNKKKFTRCEEFFDGLSVVDYSRVSFQDFLSLPVKFAGYLMNMVFLATDGTAHSYPSAHAVDGQFSGTFFTFHSRHPPGGESVSLRHLPGEVLSKVS